MADPVTLQATVERVVYANDENGWAVVRITVAGGGRATAVGRLLGVRAGEELKLTGEWIDDPKYGRQFRADSFLALEPSTLTGIEKYLGSGLIAGIGPVMAKRLVERFGLDTLDVIEHHPARLSQVDGIGPVRSRKIRQAWIDQRAVRDILVFLQSHGISANFAARIFKRYGAASIDAVKANPYRLAEEIHGIGFDSADRIAESLGIARDAPERARAGVLFTLARAAEQGHMYLPRRQLAQRGEELLGIAGEGVETAIDELAASGALALEDAAGGDSERAPAYLPALLAAERASAERLRALLGHPLPPPAFDADGALAWFARKRGLELAGGQAEAVRLALARKVLVITGGPGTGKTTLVRAIVEIFQAKRLRVLQAAPTGRAAKRLSEATGSEVKTIHRLLEFDPRNGAFARNGERPLEADLLIVDEASMVDNPLAEKLLAAVPDRARLVLVGDVDQLGSVGPGKVLEEIIAAGVVPVVRLTEIFRQARRSRLVRNAHRVLRGELPELDEGEAGADFFFIERGEPEELLRTLLHLVAERVPGSFRFDPLDDIQVLTPMRRGPLGADNLNRELQRVVNPRGARFDALRGFAIGDRVMQIRNNYDLEVFNGDIGRVTGFDEDAGRLHVRFDERSVPYEPADRDQLALAYASSVHKAQGSEYPCVIMPLHPQHTIMLQRNLLYTAMTRARRLLVVVGDPKALARAVRNDRQQRRYTRLAERLRAGA